MVFPGSVISVFTHPAPNTQRSRRVPIMSSFFMVLFSVVVMLLFLPRKVIKILDAAGISTCFCESLYGLFLAQKYWFE